MTDKHHHLDPEDGVRAVALDRAHVFHSWSAQGALQPFVIAGALGCEVATLTAQLPRAELHAEPDDVDDSGASTWSRPQVAFHDYGFLMKAESDSAPFRGFHSNV